MICRFFNCHCCPHHICRNTCPECRGHYTHKWWCSKRRDVIPLPIVLPVRPVVVEKSPAKRRSSRDW